MGVGGGRGVVEVRVNCSAQALTLDHSISISECTHCNLFSGANEHPPVTSGPAPLPSQCLPV
jgi:hypothetical protein